jgi:hypothetical protein
MMNRKVHLKLLFLMEYNISLMMRMDNMYFDKLLFNVADITIDKEQVLILLLRDTYLPDFY